MWQWVKVPKGIALAAFFLPWLTVSCSGQKIASVSGMNLTTGTLSIINPVTRVVETHNGMPSLFLAVALLLVIIGLGFSFSTLKTFPDAPYVVLMASVMALGFVWVTVSTTDGASIASRASQQGGIDAATAAALIRVNYEYGLWFFTLSLVAAILLSTAIILEQQGIAAQSGGPSSVDTGADPQIPEQ